jgi:hypothetical protein
MTEGIFILRTSDMVRDTTTRAKVKKIEGINSSRGYIPQAKRV